METRKLDEKFISALLGEDELGVVVRAHTHIEASLNDLLSRLVKDQKFLKDMQLDYAQKVRLACALVLKSDFASSLLSIGKIRNDFAHKLDASLDAERVASLLKTFSPENRDLIYTTYHITLNKNSKTEKSSFKTFTPKDQFILMAVSLKAMLVVAADEFPRPEQASR
jgi:murein L,D-transpeptidase YcbB/YkuD